MDEIFENELREKVIRKHVGKLPVLIGEYDPEMVYSRLNRVLIYGCEMESKIDNNRSVPASINEQGTEVTFNTDKWKVISDGSTAWLAKGRMNSIFDTLDHLEQNKVDKIAGKSLSTNDYTNTEKAKLESLPTSGALQNAFNEKVDKVSGKGLSTNDYTAEDKAKLTNLPTSSTLSSQLDGKVDKVSGKGLSSNDLTNELKSKLENIEAQAEKNVQADWSEDSTTSDAYIRNKPSVYTQTEINSRLSGKQDTISDLNNIRSGAASGATAYQKPSSGIPESDLSEGVKSKLSSGGSAYQKPSGGIPKSDLTSAVQTSLDKADTAYQKSAGGIPATDLDEEVRSALNKAERAYEKPAGGISDEDMAQDVVNAFNLIGTAIQGSEKGAANGVASLDSNGRVPSSQLPSYVDDVLEYPNLSMFPDPGESGKIYIADNTNKQYRWSGSAYAEISSSLALGETSSTAYAGDKGKIAYNHSQVSSGNPHNVTKSDVGLGNVGNFKAVSTVASQGLSEEEKANARANIGAGTSNFSGNYDDLTNKPTIPAGSRSYSDLDDLPTLGTASAKDVAASGDASSSQVVMGNDSRLSDARPASDVSSWAKSATKPSYTATEVKAVSTEGGQGLTAQEQSNARNNIGAGTSSLVVGETSSNAFAGNRGVALEGSLSSMLEELGALSDLTGSDTLKAWLESIEERITALEGEPGPVPPEPTPEDEEFPTINYTNKFDNLVTAFDSLNPINGLISSKASIYNYLQTYYDEAEAEFRSKTSPYFQRSNFPEIEGYEEIEGLKGTNKDTYELAFDAMTAWLMAMCLSELKPSENTTSTSDDPSNYQTIYFQTAYNYKGNGRSVPLYNNYHIHCDPMHARLVAGAMYARVRGRMSASTIQSVRNDIGGSIISNITTWELLGKMNFTGSNGSDTVKLGWLVNSRLIIPDAPGPYISGTEGRHDKPWTQGQSSSLFYQTSQEDNWALYNYIIDYQADAKVRQNYLMNVEHNSDEASNLERMKTLWGLSGQTSETYSHEKRTIIANAATAFLAQTNFFFGSRKVYLNTISKGSADGNYDKDYYSFKFVSGSRGNDQDYTVSGPFADIEKYMGGNTLNGKSSLIYPFLDNVREIGDNSRWPTYRPENGRRRRPLGGTVSGSSSGDGSRSATYGSPLNGIVNYTLGVAFCDIDHESRINEYNATVGWPHDPANSYPSGHASQTMTPALMLGQIYSESDPTKLLQYMKDAYAVSVGRMITRAHWLSDTIYGRLFATMTIPLVNATSVVLANYESAKTILTGGNSGSGTITITIKNNTGSTMDIANRCRFILKSNGTVVRTYLRSSAEGSLQIANGQTGYITVDSDNSEGLEYCGSPFASQSEIAASSWPSYTGNILLYTKNSQGIYDDSTAYSIYASTSDTLEYGSTYNITCGGSGGSTDTIDIVVKNAGTSDVSIKEKIAFRLAWDHVQYSDLGPMIVNSENIRTLSPNGTAEFNNISVTGMSKWLGKTFCSSQDLIEYANLSSNISIYNSNNETNKLPVKSISSSETFRGGATYYINIGGSDASTVVDNSGGGTSSSVVVNYGSSPIPSDHTTPTVAGGTTDITGVTNVTGTVTIKNESGQSLTLLSRIFFVTYGTYAGYTGYFRWKGNLSGNSDLTLANGESQTYTVTFPKDNNQTPTVGIGMSFATSSQWGKYGTNCAYYMQAINPDNNRLEDISFIAAPFSSSYQFKVGATYTVVIEGTERC